jgi:putative membrane protein
MIPSKHTAFAILLAGVAFCGAIPALAQDRGQGDSNFVTRAVEISNSQILSAKIAEGKSTSPDVKRFAQRMLGEHTQLSHAVAPLATQVSSTLTPGQTTARQQAAAANLQALSGPEFEQHYIRDEIAELDYALRIYQSEIATTQDPGLKQTAVAGARIITAHLRMADQLAQARQIPIGARPPAMTVLTATH